MGNGVLLAWLTYNVVRFESTPYNLRILAVFMGVTAVYGTLHFVISRFGKDLDRWFGGVVAVIPIILLFAMSDEFGRLASVGYVGLSLLLQGIRADAGCEVMSIPSVVLGRRTHLMGILFAPIDLIEKHLTGPGGLPG
jgi:hypothetical protein